MQIKLVQLFRLIVATLFIFSAVAKLVDLSFFDELVAELLIGEDYGNYPTAGFWVQVLSRVIISAEILLGIAILQARWLKTLVLPTIMILLALFTIHLFYVSFDLMASGKNFKEAFLDGNCGCFGRVLPMDNLESILKNLVTMALTFYIFKKYQEDRRYFEFGAYVPALVAGGVMFLTLAMTIEKYESMEQVKSFTYSEPQDEFERNPIVDTVATVHEEDTTAHQNETEIKSEVAEGEGANNPNEKATSDIEVVSPEKDDKTSSAAIKSQETKHSPYARYTAFSDGVKANLDKGKKLVCSFSLTCGHCQEAYKEICSIASDPNLPPVFLVLYGGSFDLNHFFSQAGCKHPYVLVEDYEEFKEILAGKDFPRIDVRTNGVNDHTWDLETYNFDSFTNFFNIKLKKKSNDGIISDEIEEGGMFDF